MKAKGPQFVRYFAPMIAALKELGGSGRPAEVCDIIALRLNVSEQERAELLESGSARFDKRVHWARFYLARAGFVDASKRGVWSLTEKGEMVGKWSFDDAMQIFHNVENHSPMRNLQ